MARVIRCKEKLKELMVSLNNTGHIGHRLTLVGTLRSAINDLWAYEAVVDDWPKYNAVILRPNESNVHKFDFIHQNIYCYSQNKDAFSKLISKSDVIPWSKDLLFRAIPLHLVDKVEEEAKKHGGIFENRHGTEFYTIALPLEQLHKVIQAAEKYKVTPEYLPKGFTVDSLRPEHTDLVLDQWTPGKIYYGTNTKLRSSWKRELEHIIRHSISSCVYDADGKPLSWQLVRLDGEGGFAHTIDEYRQSGLYSFCASELVRKKYHAKIDSFGTSTQTNKTSHYITMEKFGYKNVAECANRFYTSPKPKM